jgi:5-aminolevulinate synthase
MNYNQFFKEELNKLKDEGNYRVFADLEKIAGNFPQALNYKEDNVSEVTVWCSNDYLGMSQKNIVIESMINAIQKVGAGSGGTRNISGTNHYHVLLERELFYLILDILLIKLLYQL